MPAMFFFACLDNGMLLFNWNGVAMESCKAGGGGDGGVVVDQYMGKSQKSKMAAARNLTQISFIFSPLSGTALKGKLICMQLSSD